MKVPKLWLVVRKDVEVPEAERQYYHNHSTYWWNKQARTFVYRQAASAKAKAIHLQKRDALEGVYEYVLGEKIL